MKEVLHFLSFALLFVSMFESQSLPGRQSSVNAQTNTQQKREPLEDYVGRYEVDPTKIENFVLDIALEKGDLWIKPSHEAARKLDLQSTDVFVIRDTGIPVKFIRDEKGKVARLTSTMPDGKSIDAQKMVLPAPSLKGNTEFRFQGHADARIVAVAGTFNNWNQSQYFFAKEGDHWVCRIDLAPGKYTYKFIVDGNWLVDPSNPDTEDDERGFTNSVLIVKPPG